MNVSYLHAWNSHDSRMTVVFYACYMQENSCHAWSVLKHACFRCSILSSGAPWGEYRDYETMSNEGDETQCGCAPTAFFPSYPSDLSSSSLLKSPTETLSASQSCSTINTSETTYASHHLLLCPCYPLMSISPLVTELSNHVSLTPR